MSAYYNSDGQRVPYTPASDVAAGEVVVQNTLVGVASAAISANALGDLHVRGLFDFPKDTGSNSAIEAGKKVYWDENNEVATETPSGNTYLGKTYLAATDDDEHVSVRLEQ